MCNSSCWVGVCKLRREKCLLSFSVISAYLTFFFFWVGFHLENALLQNESNESGGSSAWGCRWIVSVETHGCTASSCFVPNKWARNSKLSALFLESFFVGAPTWVWFYRLRRILFELGNIFCMLKIVKKKNNPSINLRRGVGMLLVVSSDPWAKPNKVARNPLMGLVASSKWAARRLPPSHPGASHAQLQFSAAAFKAAAQPDVTDGICGLYQHQWVICKRRRRRMRNRSE